MLLENGTDLLFLLAAGTGLGTGTTLALKTLKNFRSTRPVADEDEFSNEKTKSDRSGRRNTNCLSLLKDGTIRTRTGQYVRGFWLDPAESLWDSAAGIDHLYDELAKMLRANLPVGTGLQFRLSVHPEDGEYLLHQKLETIGKENTHPIAEQLKLDQLDHLSWLSGLGLFQRSRLTLWVYLPLKSEEEEGRNIITESFRNFKNKGFKGLKPGKDYDIVKRRIDEEKILLEKARSLFEEVKQTCPLGITEMNREETWQALYFGYNENADSVPPAPVSALSDLKPLLCSGESIKHSNNWYLLHGNTPVTLLSMFVPPESNGKRRGCFAGMMRKISNNAGIRGRFTIIPEYITQEKADVEKRLSFSKYKIKIASNRPSGGQKPTKKNKAAFEQIDQIEEELVSQSETIVKMRLTFVVYGDQAFTKDELDKSTDDLQKLVQKIIKNVRKYWSGADVAIEEPLALREIYETTLLGNMKMKDTGRELFEQIFSYCSFIPAEDAWQGMKSPHTVKKTLTGKRFGINLWNNPLTKSPTVCVLGGSGAGKSIEVGTIITDALATMPNCRVNVVDFGETHAPLCEVLEGRHIRYLPDEVRTINVWDYKGLEIGEPPDEAQLNLVVEDTAILAGFDPDTDLGRVRTGIIYKCVSEVYKDFVPRNLQSNGRRYEPTLTHLINKLRHFNFETAQDLEQAAQLASILMVFEKHPWLDAPTHEFYRQESRFDVFELDSLDQFPLTVRKVLAFRTGSRVIRAIGEKNADGEYTPTLNIFEEMHEYNDPDQKYLRYIFRAMKKGGRKGRKTNVITMLSTHGYEDMALIPDVTRTAGVFIIGKQDDVTELKKMRKWTDEVAAGVLSVDSKPGDYAQFVVNVGMGDNQKTELIQSDLSSLMLWTLTSDPNERNARERVKRHFPHFSTFDACSYLAGIYPRGLTYSGKTEIDAIHLPPLPAGEQEESPRELEFVDIQKPSEAIEEIETAEIFSDFGDEEIDDVLAGIMK